MKIIRPYCELQVDKYFGLPDTVTANTQFKGVDYTILVNLVQVACDDIAKKAFVAGRSKTSFKQFKSDHAL